MDIKEIIKNLELIIDVTPDYVQGRRRGLTDDETEMLAYKAVYEAIEVLEKLENGYECPEYCTTWNRIRHINIEWEIEEKEGEEKNRRWRDER